MNGRGIAGHHPLAAADDGCPEVKVGFADKREQIGAVAAHELVRSEERVDPGLVFFSAEQDNAVFRVFF